MFGGSPGDWPRAVGEVMGVSRLPALIPGRTSLFLLPEQIPRWLRPVGKACTGGGAVLRFLLRGRGASLQVWGRVIVFRGGGSSLGGGRDASDCRIPPPFPLDLGNERGGVRAAAEWARGTDLIQNRLWGLTAKLEVESGGGTLAPYLLLTGVPCEVEQPGGACVVGGGGGSLL